jgi:hypothetical protein
LTSGARTACRPSQEARLEAKWTLPAHHAARPAMGEVAEAADTAGSTSAKARRDDWSRRSVQGLVELAPEATSDAPLCCAGGRRPQLPSTTKRPVWFYVKRWDEAIGPCARRQVPYVCRAFTFRAVSLPSVPRSQSRTRCRRATSEPFPGRSVRLGTRASF